MIDRSVVRVFGVDGPVGVGFLVGPGVVLTCAHVVAGALGVAHPSPGAKVRIDFPILAPGAVREAEVVHLLAQDEADLVGLRVGCPPNAQAVRVVARADLRGHRVRAFGVPEHRGHGVWTLGVVRGLVADGLIHIEDTRMQGLPLLPGFSGSPLIDDDLGAVIGMILSVEQRQERRTGYALSGPILYDAWPELAEFAAQPCPFRGLEPFGLDDAPWFFGREQQTKDIVDMLGKSGLVVVSGPSGSGKSSTVLAGVLPSLVGDYAAACVVRPGIGRGPWVAVAGGLADLLHPEGATLAEIDELADRLVDGQVEDVVNRVLVRGGLRQLVVVLDQLDEAVARYPDEVAALLLELFDLVETHRRTPIVDLVVTVSSGALEWLLEDNELGPRLTSRIVVLGVPGADELRAVVEGPLASVGMPVLEPGLTDTLLTDMARERNPLPMLEFCLTLLWDRQDRGQLTHRAYRELGGISGVVAGYAEGVWDRFATTEESAGRFRRLFSQLVSPLPDDEVVRRPMAVDLLGDLGKLAEEVATTRLLTIRTGPDQVPVVELVHEALIHHWHRLGDWVAADREFRLWQDDLEIRAQQWDEQDDHTSLLRGRALARAREIHRNRPADLLEHHVKFLRNSVSAHRFRRTWQTTAVMAVLVLIVGLVRFLTDLAEERARSEAVSAANVLLRQGDNSDMRYAAPLAIRAFRTADTLRSREELRGWARVLRHAVGLIPNEDPDGVVTSGNSSGTRVLVRTRNDSVEVWDFTSSTPHRIPLPRAADSRGGTAWLGSDRVVGQEGPTIVVWNARTGKRELTLRSPKADFIAGDVRGRWIAYGAAGATQVHLVDTSRPDAPPTVLTAPGPLASNEQPPPGSVTMRDVLPSGEVVVDRFEERFVLSATGVRTIPRTGDPIDLDLTEPAAVACDQMGLVMRGILTGTELARYDSPVCDKGVFSADGRTVALIKKSVPGRVYVGPADGSRSGIDVWIPFGTRVERVGVEDDGTYWLLVRSDESFLVLRIPPPDGMYRALHVARDAVVTRDGKHVLVAAPDMVSLWQIETRKRVALAPTGLEWTGHMRVSPDGRLLAAVTYGGSVVLLRLPDLTSVGTLPAAPLPFTGMWFLDDRRVAIMRDDAVSVWDVETRSQLGETIRLSSLERYLYDVTVAAVGTDEIVAVTGGGVVGRYRIDDGSLVAGSKFRSKSGGGLGNGPVLAVEPSERRVALVFDDVGVDAVIEVWDLDSRELEDRLELPKDVSVMHLRFGSDSDDLEAAVTGGYSPVIRHPEDGTMTMVWERNRLWGLPAIVGMSTERTEWSAPSTPSVYVTIGTLDLPSVESANPESWLASLCRLVRANGLDDEPDNLPSAAWQGDVCPAGEADE